MPETCRRPRIGELWECHGTIMLCVDANEHGGKCLVIVAVQPGSSDVIGGKTFTDGRCVTCKRIV